MKEIWKNVVGYDGKYVISNLGRICKIERIKILESGKEYRIMGKMKSQRTDKYGNNKVKLCGDDGKARSHFVCLLAAKAFLGYKSGCGMYVRHKDGNNSNDVLSNLEIVIKNGGE